MRPRWRLALEWMLATTAGVVLTHLVMEILFAAVLGYFLLFLLPVLAGAVGAAIAVFQWLVLRRLPLKESGWWILATIAGFAAAWGTAFLLTAVLFKPFTFVGSGMAIGAWAVGTLVLGLAQFLVLRRWTSRAAVWIPATTLAWTPCAVIYLSGLKSLPAVSEIASKLVSAMAGYSISSSLSAAVFAGLCAGTISGMALAFVLPEGAS
jgi:hypothetical protein